MIQGYYRGLNNNYQYCLGVPCIIIVALFGLNPVSNFTGFTVGTTHEV